MSSLDTRSPSGNWPLRCPLCGDSLVVALPPNAAAGHIGASTCWYGHHVPYRFTGARVVAISQDPTPVRPSRYVRIPCRACGEATTALIGEQPRRCEVCSAPFVASENLPAKTPATAAPTPPPDLGPSRLARPRSESASDLRRSPRFRLHRWPSGPFLK